MLSHQRGELSISSSNEDYLQGRRGRIRYLNASSVLRLHSHLHLALIRESLKRKLIIWCQKLFRICKSAVLNFINSFSISATRFDIFCNLMDIGRSLLNSEPSFVKRRTSLASLEILMNSFVSN